MIEQTTVGGREATVIWLADEDFTPAESRDDAIMVKIIFKDGGVMFAFVNQDKAQPLADFNKAHNPKGAPGGKGGQFAKGHGGAGSTGGGGGGVFGSAAAKALAKAPAKAPAAEGGGYKFHNQLFGALAKEYKAKADKKASDLKQTENNEKLSQEAAKYGKLNQYLAEEKRWSQAYDAGRRSPTDFGQYETRLFQAYKRSGLTLTTGDESEAVAVYTSPKYRSINAALRMEDPDYLPSQHRTTVDELDELIASQTTKEDLYVYRGISRKSPYVDAPPPPLVEDHGFISTSLGYELPASTFAKLEEEDRKGTVLRIRVPAGTNAAFISYSLGFEDQPNQFAVNPEPSHFIEINQETGEYEKKPNPNHDPDWQAEPLKPDPTEVVEAALGAEAEILLPRGSRFQLLRPRDPKTGVVEALYLPPDAPAKPRVLDHDLLDFNKGHNPKGAPGGTGGQFAKGHGGSGSTGGGGGGGGGDTGVASGAASAVSGAARSSQEKPATSSAASSAATSSAATHSEEPTAAEILAAIEEADEEAKAAREAAEETGGPVEIEEERWAKAAVSGPEDGTGSLATENVYRESGLTLTTADESPAVEVYTSSTYRDLNAALRSEDPDDNRYYTEPVKELDDLIQSERTQEDIYVWRGVSRKSPYVDAPPPALIEDHGYVSTSFGYDTPAIFAKMGEGKHTRGALYKIRLPKGTNAAFVSYSVATETGEYQENPESEFTSEYNEETGEYEDVPNPDYDPDWEPEPVEPNYLEQVRGALNAEAEVLLPRGTRLHILKRDEDTGIVEALYVPPASVAGPYQVGPQPDPNQYQFKFDQWVRIHMSDKAKRDDTEADDGKSRFVSEPGEMHDPTRPDAPKGSVPLPPETPHQYKARMIAEARLRALGVLPPER